MPAITSGAASGSGAGRGKALVTGASSGIGRACAEILAERGFDLLLVARRKARIDELAARLGDAHGVVARTWKLDVRDRAAVAHWAQDAAPELERLDVLVNNAGLSRGLEKIQEGDQDDWQEMIDCNVSGLLHVSREVLPHLVARGSGHVVNVGSVAGRWVYPGGAVYCASKHAVRALTEGMRLDLLGTGVRVATVDPGMVDTEFSTVRFHGDAERARKVYEGLTPLAARDVAEVVGFVLDRPRHVSVSEVVVYPTDQASPTLSARHAQR